MLPRPGVCTFLAGSIVAAAIFWTAILRDTAAAEDMLAPCLACHGADGRSTTPEVPSLGGQPAFYLSIQLYMFRERMRVQEPMNSLLEGISDADLQRWAAKLSGLPPPPPVSGPVDPNRIERARMSVDRHRCNFCHDSDFSGEQNVPRLAGQREDYLIKTLREYKNNTRRGYDAAMADVMYAVTDREIMDLSYFLARQP